MNLRNMCSCVFGQLCLIFYVFLHKAEKATYVFSAEGHWTCGHSYVPVRDRNNAESETEHGRTSPRYNYKTIFPWHFDNAWESRGTVSLEDYCEHACHVLRAQCSLPSHLEKYTDNDLCTTAETRESCIKYSMFHTQTSWNNAPILICVHSLLIFLKSRCCNRCLLFFFLFSFFVLFPPVVITIFFFFF